MKTETVNSIIGVVVFIVAMLGIIFLALWIMQVAFGYFGFEFTMWQVFIIWLASTILIKTHITVPGK